MNECPEQTTWPMRIQSVQRRIEANLGEEIPLEDLARSAHASMFHFHRVFRGVTGETVRSYQRRLRLERAAHRLRHHDEDILRVALDAGYDSHEAFTRAYQRHFGVTPSVHRDQRVSGATRVGSAALNRDIDVRIRRRAPARVACVRHVGGYGEVGRAWKTLMQWGWARALFGKAVCFGLCYDDPEITDEGLIRYEACMEVGDRAKAAGEVSIQDNPGRVYAVCLHEGAYENLGCTYAALCAAVVTGPIEGRAWRLGDPPSLEVYLNDPRKTPPAELRTEVWMPVSAG